MVKIRKYAAIIETQTTGFKLNNKVVLAPHPLQYVGSIWYDTEEEAWNAHTGGARVVGVIPIEFEWDNKGCAFSKVGEIEISD